MNGRQAIANAPGKGGCTSCGRESEVPRQRRAAVRTRTGIVLLPHLHVRRRVPGGGFDPASGAPRLMDPAGMNPGFIDPGTDALRVNTSPAGLQTRLNELVARSFARHRQKVGVALVDLTGPRRFNPDFAGWRSTAVLYGASAPKICALYAARQLGFDLQAIALQNAITTRDRLLREVRARWEAKGLVRRAHPAIEELFEFAERGASPVTINPAARLEKLIECTFKDNCNWAASLLIDRLGHAYIASVLWQSGLFHPRRAGLWVRGLYGENRSCCFRRERLLRGNVSGPLPPSHSGMVPRHSLSALSLATFFTLMAQGRLANKATSVRLLRDLQPACSFFGGILPCQEFQPPSKCGIWNGYVHDGILIQRRVGAGCSGKRICYAVALVTKDLPGGSRMFAPFLTEVDALVQRNNP